MHTHTHPHTHTHNSFTALWILSGTTQVSRYQKKHSPTHTCHGHQSSPSASFIYYDPWRPLFNLHAWHVFFYNLCPSFLWSTSWPGSLHIILHTFLHQIIDFLSQQCPYHHNMFCCSTEIMSSNPSLSLNPLLGTLPFSLMLHIYLWPFASLPAEVPPHFPFFWAACNILLCPQLLYNLPLIINGTNCLNLFHTIRVLVSTSASAYPSTFNMSPK